MAELIVILYHNFCKTPSEIQQTNNSLFTTYLDKLHYHVSWLKDHNYRPVSITNVLLAESAANFPERSFLITVDGGYQGWQFAADFFSKTGIPCLFYVVTDWVRENHSAHDQYISLQLLNEIKSCSLFDIGSHTVTHAPLPDAKIDECRYLLWLEQEAKVSKLWLDDHLSQDTKHFALPWGRGQTDQLANDLKQLGYMTNRGTQPRLEYIHSFNQWDVGVTYCDKATLSCKMFTHFAQLDRMPRLQRFFSGLYVHACLAAKKHFGMDGKFYDLHQ